MTTDSLNHPEESAEQEGIVSQRKSSFRFIIMKELMDLSPKSFFHGVMILIGVALLVSVAAIWIKGLPYWMSYVEEHEVQSNSQQSHH